MKTFIALLIALFAIPAYAEKVWFRNPQITVVLETEAACTSKKVLDLIEAQYHSRFKSAAVVWQGKALEACWMDMQDGNALIADETGDYGPMPKDAFKADLGV